MDWFYKGLLGTCSGKYQHGKWYGMAPELDMHWRVETKEDSTCNKPTVAAGNQQIEWLTLLEWIFALYCIDMQEYFYHIPYLELQAVALWCVMVVKADDVKVLTALVLAGSCTLGPDCLKPGLLLLKVM